MAPGHPPRRSLGRSLALTLVLAAAAAASAPSASAQFCDRDVSDVVVEVGPRSIALLLAGELFEGDDAEEQRSGMDANADGTVTGSEVADYAVAQRETWNAFIPLGFRPSDVKGLTLDGEGPLALYIAGFTYQNATGTVDGRPLERDTLLQLNYTGAGSTSEGAKRGDHTAVFGEDFEELCPIQFDAILLGAAEDWHVLTDSVTPEEKLDWWQGEEFVVPYADLPEVASKESPLEFTIREEGGGKKKGPGPDVLVTVAAIGAALLVAAARRPSA